MKTPILGSSYVARSVNAADSRMVNLFPEVVPDGGKEPAFLQRCPGSADPTHQRTNAPTHQRTNANYQPYITVYMWKRTA